MYQWLVDLDAVPRRLGFRSSDHLGDPRLPIKANVETYLAGNDATLGDGGRVVMLAHARVLGHVFNPLSVFWCYRADGRLAAVIAEVHNTYGVRHAYLLRPDADDCAETAKRFRVSPFFDVVGSYEVRCTLRADLVSTAVTLRRHGEVVFVASFSGRPKPATAGKVTRTLFTQPLMTQRVSALIRIHGVWLWGRGLPVQPRRQPVRAPER